MEKHETCSERTVERQRDATNEDCLSELTKGRCPVNFPVAVVLPAAGSGERTGLSTPKQFCKILGRPLISYTIHAFERVFWIDSIVVVVAKESHDLMTDIIQKYNHTKVKIVEGGSTRHRSIFNGLLAFSEQGFGPKLQKPKVVIIHDAVRPFLEEDFLLKITLAANKQGASGAVRPLVSTVVAATTGGYLDHSLERARYRASEMPQGFIYDIIYQAYQHCSEAEFKFGTECLELALQHCGTSAVLIEGPSSLWKVTHKQDLASAEAVIKESLSQSACIITGECTETQNLSTWMKNGLMAEGMWVDAIPNIEQGMTLSTNRNLIKLSVNSPKSVEIEEFMKMCEETKDVLYPFVILWVYLNVSGQASFSQENDEASAIMTLAEDAQKRNIFLYCVRLSYSKDSTECERTMNKLCQITVALIRDRSAAFSGQMLYA
ncbi:D-ribitol-5-phosphate cytidylyltransferase isoform X1 [Alosa sapidissima]|uniref:D-ribitol-5-phosphate cytidylyltransferase isoform X1 n=1 Tax=Alosa sapidissima TaxID=34773 RepID=UPI001C09C9AB|nr:D-ribitol-5-phosphate cytidylyltransferase isoform X1 [Alosa sapidissima]